MKKTIVIILIVCVLILGFWLVYYYRTNSKRIADNCRLVNEKLEIIDQWSVADCYGFIVLFLPLQEKYYSVSDYTNHRSIAEVESTDDINLVGNKIYFKPVSLSHAYSLGDYWFNYFDGTEQKKFEADSIDKLPKYLVIDIMTTAVTPYVNFEDIPVEERANFKVK